MTKNYTSITRAPLVEGDVVFVRIDCNVPLNEDGTIADAFRLEAVTPTLAYLRDKKVRIVIAGALGRPKGKRDESLTTQCIAEYYAKDVFDSCEYVSEAYGEVVDLAVGGCAPGNAIVLENLRFWSGEESNDEEFAAQLAMGMDFYVNDAFGQSHRNQASIVAITKLLPSFAGECMAKEINALESILDSKVHPSIAIVGGAKVSDKLGVIEALMGKCDAVLIGGAMAYTFLKSQGVSIGKSLCEDDYLDKAREWMESGKIILPTDSIIADSFDSVDTTVGESISDNQAGFDIGPETIERFTSTIASAQMILWNGPMGVFEKEQFARGTKEIALAVAESDAFSVVGGGDSVAAIRALGLQEKIDHVSTGGGATLEYLEQSTLVGVDALVAASASKG